jgi:hypothetical protein
MTDKIPSPSLMAMQAVKALDEDCYVPLSDHVTVARALDAFAAEAIAKEREACGDVILDLMDSFKAGSRESLMLTQALNGIRARGGK